jgi:ABC-type multidrug transport system fused ATPase/permease subunit
VAAAGAAAAVKDAVRADLYAQLLRLGLADVRRRRTGAVQSTLVDGVEALDAYVGRFLPQTIASIIGAAAIAEFLLALDPVVGAVVLACALIVPFVPQLLQKVLASRTDPWMAAYRALYAENLDAIQGMATLKVFGAAERRGWELNEPAKDFCRVSIRLCAGEHAAVVGRSGAGKTTLIGLLLRWFDPQDGAVHLGGVPVTDWPLNDLRHRVAVVSQDTYLFTARYATTSRSRPNIDDAALREALHAANATAFVDTLPDGLDTVVGERGMKLSGGERQRLSIARALLTDAPMLILDEATSSVDSANERSIAQALHGAAQGRTTSTIAHRLSSVRAGDRIIVLDRGSITETGTHDELLARSGAFARLLPLLQLLRGHRRIIAVAILSGIANHVFTIASTVLGASLVGRALTGTAPADLRGGFLLLLALVIRLVVAPWGADATRPRRGVPRAGRRPWPRVRLVCPDFAQ